MSQSFFMEMTQVTIYSLAHQLDYEFVLHEFEMSMLYLSTWGRGDILSDIPCVSRR